MKKILKSLIVIAVILVISSVVLTFTIFEDTGSKINEVFITKVESIKTDIEKKQETKKEKEKLANTNDNLERENEELKEKNQSLVSQNEALESQIKSFEDNLDGNKEIKTSNDYNLKTGQIVIRDPNNWYNEATINLGSKDGIKVGDPVVTNGVFIGTVKDVNLEYSTIHLNSYDNIILNIPSMIIEDKKEYNGIIRSYNSEENYYVLELLTPDKELKMYDKVYTNGYEEGIPRGIEIGKIVDITTDEETKKVVYHVEPKVDMYNLRDIAVMTDVK